MVFGPVSGVLGRGGISDGTYLVSVARHFRAMDGRRPGIHLI
jgi:hypothetical protein